MPKKKSRKNRPPVGASLKFPPGGEPCGLTPVSLSISSDKEAPGIVREILQNSLDAAKDVPHQCAKVVFSLEEVNKPLIPGLDSYGGAVKSIAEYNKKLGWPEQSQNIVDSLIKALRKDTFPVMFVSDNGVGLDKKRMSAILSDGITIKGNEGSSGSKGNGHFTTFNLSKLRYLLYGGVSEADGMLASGHTILSSHQGKNDVCGKNGYYVEKINRKIDNLFDFPTGKAIPPIIKKKLEDIKSTEGSGALLGILDFNYFGHPHKTLQDMQNIQNLILSSAARNFFVGIGQGEIVVTFKSKNGETRIDADNLSSVMDEISPKIGKTRNFPSHDKANKFYRLFVDGQRNANGAVKISIKTNAGNFDVIYRQSQVVSTGIAFCRNGMWITDDIPSIKSGHFPNHVPFEALILCNEAEPSTLVRNAEGNLHNILNLSMVIDATKRKKLRDCLKSIKDKLAELITTQDNKFLEFIEVDGIGMIPDRPMRISPSSDGASGQPGGRKSNHERIVPVPSNRTNSPKPGKTLPVRCIATRQGVGQMKIRIVPLDDSADVELRLVRNGGGDFSCDDPSHDNKRITLKSVICGDKECSISNDNKEYVRIGKVAKGEEKSIDIKFDEEEIKGGYKVDCQFIRRASSHD